MRDFKLKTSKKTGNQYAYVRLSLSELDRLGAMGEDTPLRARIRAAGEALDAAVLAEVKRQVGAELSRDTPKGTRVRLKLSVLTLLSRKPHGYKLQVPRLPTPHGDRTVLTPEALDVMRRKGVLDCMVYDGVNPERGDDAVRVRATNEATFWGGYRAVYIARCHLELAP